MTELSTSLPMEKDSEATRGDVVARCNLGDLLDDQIFNTENIEDSTKGVPEKQLDFAETETVITVDLNDIRTVKPYDSAEIETLKRSEPKMTKMLDSAETETVKSVDRDDIVTVTQDDSAKIETLKIANLADCKMVSPVDSVDNENGNKIFKSFDRAQAESLNHVELAKPETVNPADLDDIGADKADDHSEIETLKITNPAEIPVESARKKSTDREETETLNNLDLTNQKTFFMDIDLGNANHDEVLPKCESNPESTENSKFKIIRARLKENLKHLHVKHHKMPSQNPNFIERLKHSLLLPPHGSVAEHITLVLMILTLWITCMSMFGKIAVPPNGTHFLLIALVVVATLVGQLFALARLPPLLGMIVTGIALKNLPGVSFDDNWIAYSQTLRGIALVVILLQAGLGLDPVALRRLSGLVFGLAFIPGLIEASTVAVASHFLLGLPWLWGFMLGFVLAAASPAVVVPLLLALQEQGLGVAKGIPTLIIAASSVDDVLAISVFTITLGITFKPNTNIVAVVFQGPIEAIVGLLFGIFWGLLVTYIPGRDCSERNFGRLFLLLGGALLAMFGSSAQGVELPGSGALAVIVMAFVAGIGWRKQSEDDYEAVNEMLSKLWIIFQPLLFGLIGTEIRINELNPSTLGMGILVLVICLTIRIVASFGVVSFTDLTLKERIFVALAWLPKATVQAALGPLALDTAKTLGSDRADGPELIAYGEIVLTVAVLVILITAPIGAIVIRLLGPKWLSKASEEKEDVEKDS